MQVKICLKRETGCFSVSEVGGLDANSFWPLTKGFCVRNVGNSSGDAYGRKVGWNEVVCACEGCGLRLYEVALLWRAPGDLGRDGAHKSRKMAK
jgi:hypothetical protein